MKKGNANRTAQGISVVEALRRYPNCPLRTLARYLVQTQGILFKDSFDVAYDRVRYYAGKKGDMCRRHANDKTLFRKDVKLPVGRTLKRSPYKLNAGSWLVLSDIHIPFHSEKAIETAVAFGQKRKVDGILFGGDAMDCLSLSFWPTANRDFPAEVEAMADFLDWMKQEFPTQKMVYIRGNHEYRLERFFIANAPELVNMPTSDMESTLGMEQRGIVLLEDKQVVMAGKLPIIHGHECRVSRGSVNAAKSLFNKFKSSGMCSHLHSTSEHSTSNVSGDLLTTWSVGALCDLKPDYCPINDWNWGCALINVEKNGNFEVENRRILPSGKIV